MSYEDVLAVRSIAQALELAGVESAWGVALAEIVVVSVAAWTMGRKAWAVACVAWGKVFPGPGPVAAEIIRKLATEEAAWDEHKRTLDTCSLTVVLTQDQKDVQKIVASGVDAWLAVSKADEPAVRAAIAQAILRVRDRERLQRQQSTLDALAARQAVPVKARSA